ncbi:MAG TPA: glycosyltransferase family 4 protein, partial [Bacteroidia bacterium]|nr:glycosyltransferase family 4 protein [Bacteroidia bacterium]
FAVHFHEFRSQFNYISAEELMLQTQEAKFLVYCSNAVGEALNTIGVKNKYLLYEAVDLAAIQPDHERTQQLRKELGISPSAKVIVMSGSQAEIKGIDIFVRVAEQLKSEPLHFLWLGSPVKSAFSWFWTEYAKKSAANITFCHPAPADYYPGLALADLFFLSSRTDPFPLVMIEAAYLGKFIAGLDSGGVSEFVQDGCGVILPTWNADEIAGRVRDLCAKLPAGWSPEKSTARAKQFDSKDLRGKFEQVMDAVFGNP